MSDLPSGWTTATVGEIASLTDGPFGSNLKTSHYVESGPRVVRLQNIGDGVFRDGRAHITLEHFQRLAKHEVLQGDVVAASLGEDAPRACLIPAWLGPAVVKADCIRIRAADGVEPGYLMWMLNSPPVRREAAMSIKGVGRPRLGLGGIKRLEVPLPPFNEQRRIVAAIEEHLSRLDAAETSAGAALRRVQALRKSVLTDWYPETCPVSWKTSVVGEVGQVVLGRQRSPRYHHGPNMRPYLRVANVFEDRLDLSDVMEMDFPPSDFAKYRLEPGDILLNEGQSPHLVGRAAVFRGELDNACFTNSLIRFRPGSEVDGAFAMLVFRRHLHAGRFMREARITTNIAHLSAGRLKTVEFPVPPLDTQRSIVAEIEQRLSAIDALRAGIERVQRRSAALRRAVLERAFRGELVPQDQSDEPASELLARIRAEERPKTSGRRRRRQAPIKEG